MDEPKVHQFIGEFLDEPRSHIWRWIRERVEPYPKETFIAPMRPRKGLRKPRVFHGGELVSDASGSAAALRISRRDGLQTLQLASASDQDRTATAELLARALFTKGSRGSVVVFADGARHSLHVLLRLCWRGWVALGYRVKPLGVGTDLRYLVVSKDKNAWYLADWQGLTGLDPTADTDPISTLAGVHKTGVNLAVACRLAAERYQEVVNDYFGVLVGLSVGATSVAAMCRHVPADAWVWRPPPGLVALCRLAGGYRGGHVHYPPYRGEVHRADINRAYTWALSIDLPVSAAQSSCHDEGREQPGIYLCEIEGPGQHPISIAEWQGEDRGFVRRNWNGPHATAFLLTDEMEGVRALGYKVTPGYGYCWRKTWSLRSFTAACEQLRADFGAKSPEGLVAKVLANGGYGKLGERPIRMETIMSADRPSDEHHPFCDASGEEVADVWCKWQESYRPHQHVDMAAAITARVRGRLYCAVASVLADGNQVVAADTDGLLLRHHPGLSLGPDDGRPGQWRYEGSSAVETVAGPRLFTFRGTVYAAGTSSVSAKAVAIAFDKGTVTVEGKVMAPPWSDGAVARTVTRRLRRAASP